MTQRDMAGYLNVDVKTLRNWRKNKPNLYKIIMLGFGVLDVAKQTEKNNEDLKKLIEEFGK